MPIVYLQSLVKSGHRYYVAMADPQDSRQLSGSSGLVRTSPGNPQQLAGPLDGGSQAIGLPPMFSAMVFLSVSGTLASIRPDPAWPRHSVPPRADGLFRVGF